MDNKCCGTCEYGKRLSTARIQDVDPDTKTVTMVAEKQEVLCLYELPKEVMPESCGSDSIALMLFNKMLPNEGTKCPVWKERDDDI